MDDHLFELSLAGAVFVATHLGLSSTRLRGVLATTLGERGFLGVYSIVALGAIVWLVMAYRKTGTTAQLWGPDVRLHWAAFVAMPIAFASLVGGFLVRNPTAVGQEAQVASVGEGGGMLRITRHPFQWAVVLWAAAHVIANGDLASIVFFGSFGAVSLAGTFLIDRKKATRLGTAWQPFANATSNVPFAAIAAGRNKLVLNELWLPIAIGVALYAVVLLWGHRWIAGVPLL
jgi:uncharacterized membrane protein